MKKIGVALMVIGLLATGWFISRIPTQQVIDTAIIGGGISGIYAAYRLGDDRSVAIYEANDRLGGRILTVEVPDTDGLRVELGAMRFLHTQQNINGLITKELKLPIQDARYLSHTHFYYLNNNKILPEDFQDHPDHISFVSAIHAIVPGIQSLDNMSQIEQHLRTALVRDSQGQEKFLYELSANEVLKTYLSPQEYNLLYDASGFKAFFDEHSNAYDIFLHILSHYKTQDFFELTHGASALIDSLTQKITEQGVMIYKNHRLTNIQRVSIHSEPLFALYFGEERQYARQVILTISPKALMSLDPDSILFSDPQVLERMNSMNSVAAQKLFFVYDTPWWSELGYQPGRAYTDLSIQQFYYFHSNPKAAILLAAYKDTWELLTPMEAQTQLQTIHGDFILPLPRESIYMDWGKLPYGGAIHLWKPKVKSWELIPQMRKPYPDLELFIAGDNFAHTSAWVEGAINSVEMLLITEFGLDRAAWISDDYYLSP